MKICSECKQERTEEEFSFKNKEKGTKHCVCKICNRKRLREHYRRNKDYYKTKAKKRSRRVVEENKVKICDYLESHPCIDCKEENIIVLEFDHLRDKHKDVMRMVANSCAWERVLKEIAKCEVVCCNCHRIRTMTRRGTYRTKY